MNRSADAVTIARSFEEVEALLPVWHELQGDNIATDPGYFAAVVENEPHMLRPHVVLVEGPGSERCVVVARLEEVVLPCKIGYRTIYAPRARSLTVAYGGLLGDDSECARRGFDALRRAVDDGEADVVSFRQLRPDSPFRRLASDVVPWVCRQRIVEQAGLAYELGLPATYDEFLASLSSRTRANVRSYGNRLRRDFDGRHELRVLREPREIDEIFELIAAVSRKTYQSALGRGFADDAATRARIALALDRGWFRAWVLSLDGEPAAFWHGIAYRGRFTTGIPGYDPSYRKQRVGTYVLCRVIEDLCADDAVQTLDFGFGDAEYKRHFGTRSWEEETRVVYARRFRPVRINLTRTAALAASTAARAVVERLGLSQRIKTSWRRRLGRGAAAAPQDQA